MKKLTHNQVVERLKCINNEAEKITSLSNFEIQDKERVRTHLLKMRELINILPEKFAVSDNQPVNTKQELEQIIQEVADELRQAPSNSIASAKEYYKDKKQTDMYYPYRVGHLESAITKAADKLEALNTGGLA